MYVVNKRKTEINQRFVRVLRTLRRLIVSSSFVNVDVVVALEEVFFEFDLVVFFFRRKKVRREGRCIRELFD